MAFAVLRGMQDLTEEELTKLWAAQREATIAASVKSAMDALDPQPTELDGALFRLLLICAHRVGVEVAARIHVGESVMALLVLQLLAGPRPPVTGKELAGALGCTRSAVTQTLDRLERRGKVKRHVDSWDHRVKTIELTEAAMKGWDEAHGPLCALMRQATSSFSPDEKEQLRTLLMRIERDADHARVMRAWSNAEPAPRDAATRSGVHVR